MFKNYIKVAFRNLNKNRGYAAINIFGLAMGLMVSIIVLLYVTDELSYEKHIDGYENTYRIGLIANMMGQEIDAPVSPSPMAESLRNEFEEVVAAARTQPIRQEILLKHEERKIYIEDGARVDSAFFTVFNYEFLHGNALTALKESNAIVLTEETANMFFPGENPMGEIINYDNRRDYIVRGVVSEPKGKSHFKYNFFMADNGIENVWISNNYYTYFRLQDGIQADQFFPGMSERFFQYIAPDVERFLNVTVEEFFASNNAFEYEIHPISSIHLHSNRDWEIQQNGNVSYIYIFIAIAFLVILIAGINFMNLSTARSSKRAKEVGIRKVSGANKGMLITQFLTESVVQSFIALFLAFIMVELFLPGFNSIMETDLELFNGNFLNTFGIAFLITAIYGLFSGSYPAFFLSKFQPVTVLKGDMTKTKGGSLFRKTLVVVQFTASVILMIGMIIIFMQISYMQNKDLGFNADQVLVVPIQTDEMTENFRSYKKEFLKIPNVLNVSRSSYLPGDPPNQTVFEIEGRKDALPIWNMEVDFDFFETLDLQLFGGRGFESEISSDSSIQYILNETAIESFNIKDPIGKRFFTFGRQGERIGGTVIGIVKDFHVEGFNQPINPMILSLNNNVWFASFKISPENMPVTIGQIEDKWNSMEPSHPFRYKFLDDKFGALFKSQVNFGKMFLYLTILAIIIAAMGLFGLASFTAEQKTKEISIRKVLGASVLQLMRMLSKEFVKLVIIANIFAWPITFILSKEWLSRFSYQIDIPILPFIAALIAAVIIALATVSYQAYKAAIADPVIALKYE